MKVKLVLEGSTRVRSSLRSRQSDESKTNLTEWDMPNSQKRRGKRGYMRGYSAEGESRRQFTGTVIERRIEKRIS